MKKFLLFLPLALLLGGCVSNPPLQTVPEVDLVRYGGKWYEIASIPTWFEKGCHNVTATYTPLPNGTIQVINRCTDAKGKLHVTNGTASVVPHTGNARLKVKFGHVTGAYDIIGLDRNYQWAVVGHPSRNYLWILSRTPQMDAQTYAHLVDIAKGHDYSHLGPMLRKTQQDAAPSQ